MSANSRIFIPHLPYRIDENGNQKAVYDISPALQYGSEFISPIFKGKLPIDTKEICEAVKLTFEAHNYTSDDYILCIGSPEMIGIATVFAAKRANTIRLLVWDRNHRKYIVRVVDVDA